MTPKNVTTAAQELRRRKTLLEAKLKELCDISPEREELRIESEADPMDQVCSSADRELAIRANRLQDPGDSGNSGRPYQNRTRNLWRL